MTKKVAILGFGVEGRAAYRYFVQQGASITILDEKQPTDVPAGVQVEVGPDIFMRAMGYDKVVRTPSIRPDRIKTDGQITSGTIEFFAVCPAPIIGVTGSKGKGTTASFIHEILRAAGKKTYLVGNIGLPALEILPEVQKQDVVVYELSSFQLLDLSQSPHLAIVLMIEPEHLDVHANLAEYVEAKAAICKYQTKDDTCYYHPTNTYARQIAESNTNSRPAFRYATSEAVYIKDDQFYKDGQAVCPTSAVQLPGRHNLENACAAISAVLHFTNDFAAVERGLRNFTGLPHRLKLVAQRAGVAYYDDSIATTPGSAIAALKAFEQPKIIILGGSDKGADFDELAREVTSQGTRAALLIGDMRHKIQAALKDAGFTNVYLFDQQAAMAAIVEKAQQLAQPGDAVILSPACASFGMFKNYADRGDQFIAAVKSLE